MEDGAAGNLGQLATWRLKNKDEVESVTILLQKMGDYSARGMTMRIETV